ncbi:MAG: nitrous oxide reductase family maturation protein NosD [Ekhidna sp.]|uniref:nitrous oxide reductase family maturation protein NosD n=1 Tax=Ekhidna sp. TaxID=2608089 RepID=UPI0032ED2ED8
MSVRIIVLLFCFFVGHCGLCSTYTVCNQCELSTIKSAIDKASPGDTLIFDAGIYESQGIEITKSLVLIGKEGAILDGGGKDYILKILADDVSVSGFELVNSGRSYTKDYAAIYIYKTSGFILSNNVITKSFFGILAEKSKNGQINQNKVLGTATREDQSGNGIHLWDCDSVKIAQNEVSGMRDGIYLEFVDASFVQDNHSHHNVRYGLHFMFSNHDEYRSNTFEKNGAGVAVMFSKWIKMKDNRFIQNWGTASYGLLLKEIYDGEVENNLFDRNTIAVYVDGSSRVTYSNNVFRQNGWAVKVSGGCYANSFVANDFISNSFGISYNSMLNDNVFSGNYWSDYSGYDLDKDGVGDVPYRPVKLFSYIANKTPETIVLMRSLFVDIINFSEKVSPVFTPDALVDHSPSMNPFK